MRDLYAYATANCIRSWVGIAIRPASLRNADVCVCVCATIQKRLLRSLRSCILLFFGNRFCIHPGRELLYTFAYFQFPSFSVSLVFSLSYFSKIKLQYPLSHFRLLLNAALYNAEITMRLEGSSRVQWTYARTHTHIHRPRERERDTEREHKTFLLECNFGKYLSRAMWTMIFVKFSLNFMKNACRVSYCTFTFSQQQKRPTRQSITKYVGNKCPQK